MDADKCAREVSRIGVAQIERDPCDRDLRARKPAHCLARQHARHKPAEGRIAIRETALQRPLRDPQPSALQAEDSQMLHSTLERQPGSERVVASFAAGEFEKRELVAQRYQHFGLLDEARGQLGPP